MFLSSEFIWLWDLFFSKDIDNMFALTYEMIILLSSEYSSTWKACSTSTI